MDAARFTTLWIYTILKRNAYKAEEALVSLPYGFTLFSNRSYNIIRCYEVSLPYGFTLFSNAILIKQRKHLRFTTLWIYTILKPSIELGGTNRVSLPYGFTLFSNFVRLTKATIKVSLPYGFTLFSNTAEERTQTALVSLPYGFTLFSNRGYPFRPSYQFHYLMDLHYSQTFPVATAICP